MTTHPNTGDSKRPSKEELPPGGSAGARNEVAHTTDKEWQKVGDFFRPNNPDKLLARADLVLPEEKTKSAEKIFSFENAREIVNGKEIPLNPKEKLAPGDHLLRFPFEKQGKHKGEPGFREALVHVPPADPANPNKALPVVFAFHGALPESMGPEKFRTTLDLDKKADSKGIIVVYPHAELHAIKEGGKPVYVWNVPQAIVPKEDVERHAAEVGHHENDFIAGLTKITRQMTNATAYNAPNGLPGQKWLLAAHSQATAAAPEILSDPRMEGVFPKVVAICGIMEKGNDRQIANGNAETVVVIDPGGDKTIVPARTDKSGQAISKLFSQVSKLADPTGLGALNVAAGNPQELIMYYLNRLGDSGSLEKLRQVFTAADPDKSFKSLADYSQRLANPAPFNPDAISANETLNVFRSATGKSLMFLLHIPDANHLVIGGNHPSASRRASSAQVITDLVTDNGVLVANLEEGRPYPTR